MVWVRLSPNAVRIRFGGRVSLAEYIHSVATGPKRRRERLTPLGFLVFGTTLAVVIVGGLYTDRWLGLPPFLPGIVGTAAGHWHRLKQFYKKFQTALLIHYRQHFYIHMLLAPGRLMDMQNPLPLARTGSRRQRALFSRLVAGSVVVV